MKDYSKLDNFELSIQFDKIMEEINKRDYLIVKTIVTHAMGENKE